MNRRVIGDAKGDAGVRFKNVNIETERKERVVLSGEMLLRVLVSALRITRAALRCFKLSIRQPRTGTRECTRWNIVRKETNVAGDGGDGDARVEENLSRGIRSRSIEDFPVTRIFPPPPKNG